MTQNWRLSRRISSSRWHTESLPTNIDIHLKWKRGLSLRRRYQSNCLSPNPGRNRKKKKWIPGKGGSLPSDLGGFATYMLIFPLRYLPFHSRIYWLTRLIHMVGGREGWQGTEHGPRLFASKTTHKKRRIARLWVWGESGKSSLRMCSHSGLKRWFARNKEVKKVTSPSGKKMHRMRTVLPVHVCDREPVQTGGKNSWFNKTTQAWRMGQEP